MPWSACRKWSRLLPVYRYCAGRPVPPAVRSASGCKRRHNAGRSSRCAARCVIDTCWRLPRTSQTALFGYAQVQWRDIANHLQSNHYPGFLPQESTLARRRSSYQEQVMTYGLAGACHCENISFELELASAPGSYSPRVCDCVFCRKHGAAYLSDPHGSLRFHVNDAHRLGRYRQGSGLADFLVCKDCGVLVGITYSHAGRLYGTVNSNALDGNVALAEAIMVSPKKLSDDEKLARWTSLWFCNVQGLSQ